MRTILANSLLFFAAVSISSAKVDGAECPFCSAVKQTLRQEIETMDAVAIGELVAGQTSKGSEIDGNATFKILKVLRGDSVIHVDQKIEAAYFGPSKSDKHFLLMGVDPAQLLWSSPLPVTAKAEAYILKIPSLPENPVERLKHYQNFLEDEDTLLARDAYDEFAISPYEEVKQLKPSMNREQLIKWIEDDKMTADRKRLYFTMLGVCGLPADADLLEKRLRSDKPESRTGLDALIACYLTLKGDAGLPLIEELFLKNQKSQYAETYSAIMALRFHGTEGGILERKKIVGSLHHILQRPELADLVIPDLARWEDWSQIEKMVSLFKEADESSSWVRVPVINYLRSCPLPEAVERLKDLEKIDPKAVQRAKTFFPLPAAQPAKTDSSLHSDSAKRFKVLAAKGDSTRIPLIDGQLAYAGSGADLGFVLPGNLDNRVAIAGQVPMLNRWVLGSVGALAVASLALAMWLVVSKSDQSQMGLIVLKSDGREQPLTPLMIQEEA